MPRPASPPSTVKKYIGNYELHRTLGEGAFAKVKLATHRLTNARVAVKIIDKEKLPDEYAINNVHREATIMKLLDHKNIIQLYEIIETKKELYLVMELAEGGEVLDYIVAHGNLKVHEAKKFFRQLAEALNYCHNLGIVHRDLKAENLLLDEWMNVKISDFGLSNYYDSAKSLSTCCGSPVYSAPELIEGRKYTGPEVDCWSLGINLFAMVVGDLPFSDNTLGGLYDSIMKAKYVIPESLDADCKDLLHKLLCVNPKKRLTCAQVLEHPWLASSKVQKPEIAHIGKITDASQIDKEIIDQLESMGFERDTAIASILGARYNQLTATYHLLLLQRTNGERAANALETSPEEEEEGDVELDELGQPIGLPRIQTRPRGQTQPVSRMEETSELNPKSALLKKHMDLRVQPKSKVRPTSLIVPAIPGAIPQESVEVDKATELASVPHALGAARTREPSISDVMAGLSPNGTERTIHPAPLKKNPRPILSRMNSAKGELNLVKSDLTKSEGMSTINLDRLPPIASKGGSIGISRVLSNGVMDTLVSGGDSGSLDLEATQNKLGPGDSDDCRTLRFAFSKSTSTSHPPEFVQQRIENVLTQEKISFSVVGYLTTATTEDLVFELEVCRVPLIEGLHAVRMKRIQGDSWEYRDMHDRIVKNLEL